jgi:hypothetical protein
MNCIEFQMIERFFNKRELGSGGPITKNLLFSPEHVDLLKIKMIPAVDIVYAALSRVKTLAKTKYDEHVGIRLIPKVLHAGARRNIPHNFIPGILLLYLELCENCEWRHLLNGIVEERRASGEWTEEMTEEVCKALAKMPGFRYAQK